MVEKTRRDVIRAIERTRASQAAIDPLKSQIRLAQDSREVQKWAVANGFVAPEWAPAPSSQESHLAAKKTPR